MSMAKLDYAAIARQYAKDVVAGKILTCKWVQRACERQLADLNRFKGKDSPYRFNPKLTTKDGRAFHPADNLCAFIERLPHVKGPLAGETIKLEPWQVFILTTVFGWVSPTAIAVFGALTSKCHVATPSRPCRLRLHCTCWLPMVKAVPRFTPWPPPATRLALFLVMRRPWRAGHRAFAAVFLSTSVRTT